jgi:5-methyltetrahydropteroyltriglutamate--homocysteine methyltransferase
MKRSDERILTTHCGSLARPHDLLDLMRARLTGRPYDEQAYEARIRSAVADCVRGQIESGVDVVSDGEQSKPGFFAYVNDRLAGFEPGEGSPTSMFKAEIDAFPEYYEHYFQVAMTGGSVARMPAMVCTGPVSYRGEEALRRDLVNLQAALQGQRPEEVFVPSVAPSGVGANRYYGSDEEYMQAVAEAMAVEYRAIVDAGFLLQIDDPFLTDLYSYSMGSAAQRQARAELFVSAINHALQGIPAERVRFHTCYGINEGPRIHDAPLAEVLPYILRVKAAAFSFEAANPRHEHEYHVWEDVTLPDGALLIPGVITHASNIVEHPEWIAERLAVYAKIVGRENVIAGADCGFSSQATYTPEVHPKVVWAKFRAMAEGAQLASKRLWGRSAD